MKQRSGEAGVVALPNLTDQKRVEQGPRLSYVSKPDHHFRKGWRLGRGERRFD
jgi:hypothetical protein